MQTQVLPHYTHIDGLACLITANWSSNRWLILLSHFLRICSNKNSVPKKRCLRISHFTCMLCSTWLEFKENESIRISDAFFPTPSACSALFPIPTPSHHPSHGTRRFVHSTWYSLFRPSWLRSACSAQQNPIWSWFVSLLVSYLLIDLILSSQLGHTSIWSSLLRIFSPFLSCSVRRCLSSTLLIYLHKLVPFPPYLEFCILFKVNSICSRKQFSPVHLVVHSTPVVYLQNCVEEITYCDSGMCTRFAFRSKVGLQTAVQF